MGDGVRIAKDARVKSKVFRSQPGAGMGKARGRNEDTGGFGDRTRREGTTGRGGCTTNSIQRVEAESVGRYMSWAQSQEKVKSPE